MRFTSLCLATACLVFLVGCSAKSSVDKFEEAKRSQPHSVTLNFNNTFCRAYFIQNDSVKYEFEKAGTYSIVPGNYLFIGQCSNGNNVSPAKYYAPGVTTELAFAPGTNLPLRQPGMITGPLR